MIGDTRERSASTGSRGRSASTASNPGKKSGASAKAGKKGVDKNDPNYESAEDEEGVVLQETKPDISLEEYKALAEEILVEYFNDGSCTEVERRLSNLTGPRHHPEFIKRAVIMALEKKSRERELVSNLLTSINGGVIENDSIVEGFNLVLDRMDDLILDNPDAVANVAQFLARAGVDEVIAPIFFSNALEKFDDHPEAVDTITKAKNMVTMKHSGARLEKVWGPGDGRSVDEMKQSIILLLEEYLSSADSQEACRCVKELGAPHFHHEVVKKGIICAIEKGDKEIKRMSSLFVDFGEEGVVDKAQIQKGFARTLEVIDDIKLDNPAAFRQFLRFSHIAVADGYLAADWCWETP
eukprot:GFYU01002546.1.p1 GENE.GFYU01002546.1~~GFYU01002546.1.p1  ORF type:complete len:354 (-),score=130.28 GFYU01002546.1:370-1431(-)